jgi:hypothetical protein
LLPLLLSPPPLPPLLQLGLKAAKIFVATSSSPSCHLVY